MKSTLLLLSFIFLMFYTVFSQTFTEIDAGLPGVADGSTAWGDYDNDGDLDLLVSGSFGFYSMSKLYKNDGNDSFIEQTTIDLEGFQNTAAEWGDYNNDGNLDILIAGGGKSIIYKNNGDNSFTKQSSISLLGVLGGDASWGDYDNDGDLDILLSGSSEGIGYITVIYKNNGDNSFAEQTGISLLGLSSSSVDWGDYDNDNDLDILLTGYRYNGEGSFSKIYKNNGDNSFTEQTDITLNGYYRPGGIWGDYDNDGDLDIFLAGSNDDGTLPKIYKNNGNNSFEDQVNLSLPRLDFGDAAWGDYDNDGDYDVVLNGIEGFDFFSKVYKNEGNNVFTEQVELNLIGVSYSSVSLVDYDDDGDLDIVITGDSGTEFVCKIYKNNSVNSNQSPSIPSNIQSLVLGNNVDLSWEKATDAETQQDALSYNLAIGTSSQAYDICTPMANISNGSRKISQQGNAGLGNTFTIKNLAAGTFYWSVQTIDNGFAGSGFSEEGSFTVTFSNSITPTNKQILAPEITGNILMVTETELPDTRQWRYSTVPGGPYENDIVGETGLNYLPNFTNYGKYYVVCVSMKNGNEIVSNEVKIDIPYFIEQTAISLEGMDAGSISWGDYDNDGNLDILMVGRYYSFVYKNNGDNTFTRQNGISFPGIRDGSAAWGDYNNDGFLDILLSGNTGSEIITNLYKNNGDNSFSEQNDIILTGVHNSSVAWGDLNNDGCIDFIISGDDKDGDPTCEIYKNIENNEFIEVKVNIVPFTRGDVELIDFNNDNLIDIALCGMDYSGNFVTKFHKNIGEFLFVEQKEIIIPGVYSGSIDFGDYNNDGYFDLIITGTMSSSDGKTKVFKNINGLDFLQQTNIELPIISSGDAIWGDYNNDGDLDILLSGNRKTDIFINEGNDVFSLLPDNSFENFRYTAMAHGDYDNDGDLDVLLAGTTLSNSFESNIYLNNSNVSNNTPNTVSGLQSLVSSSSVTLNWNKGFDTETPKNGLTYNVVISKEIDGQEIVCPMADLTSGKRRVSEIGNAFLDTSYYITELDTGTYYWSVQAIDHNFAGSSFAVRDSFVILTPFTKVNCGVIGLNSSSSDWGDYDNDGYLDLLLTGYSVDWVNSQTNYYSKIYKNNGDSTFVEQTDISLFGVAMGDVAWTDYNNDGLLDVFLTGQNDNGNYFSKIYKNNGNNSFTELINVSIVGATYGSVDWGDYNNDGWVDLVFSGNYISGNYISKIYKNNGDDTFIEQNDIILDQLGSSSTAWGDYDNDGDLDLFISGYGRMGDFSSIIYKNIGNNTFVALNDLQLVGLYGGSVDWSDYDNDGDLDILMAGTDKDQNKLTKIYRNDGDNTFIDINTLLRGVGQGNVEWGDYDNDGDLDILVSGQSSRDYTGIFSNIGNDNFEEIDLGIEDEEGKSTWVDCDNDGDLDLLVSGTLGSGKPITTLYRNNGNWINTPAEAPLSLVSEKQGYGIKLNWEKANDKESGQNGLSYNVRIGTASGTSDIISCMSDLISGKRKVERLGNAQMNTFFRLDTLPEGAYFWAVQAIDHSFMGGAWSDEQSFTITVIRANFAADTVCLGDTTLFSDVSLTGGTEITAWEWSFGDDSTSTLQNPNHVYQTEGEYQVQMVAIGGDYSDTITQTVIVKQIQEANFTSDIACQGTETNYTNSTIANGLTIINWDWSFGDGYSSTIENPTPHGYLNAGDYTASLTVKAENACESTISKTVQVGAYPNAAVSLTGNTEFCVGDSSILNVGENQVFSYQWKLNGVNISNADSSSLLINQTGEYTAQIINSIGSCESLSDAVALIVNPSPSSPTITTSGATSFCSSDSVVLSVTENTDYTYHWKLNEGAIGINSSELVARSSGAYTLEVSNATGCSVFSTNSIDVTVTENPIVPTVSISGPIEFCDGDDVTLSVANDVGLTYQWLNGAATIADSTAHSITVLESGEYALLFSNASGCISQSESQTVIVNPSPASPTISASGATIFCQGDSVLLSVTDNADYNYQWKLNEVDVGANSFEIVARSSGVYTLEVSNVSGCSVLSTNSIKVTVTENPIVPSLSITGSNQFCKGESATLKISADESISYQWFNNGSIIDGANSNSFKVEMSGHYSLMLINATGCQSQTEEKQISVFENPHAPIITTFDDTEFCEGNSVALTVIDPDSYEFQWYLDDNAVGNDNASFIAYYSGSYSVEVTDTNSCSSFSEQSIALTSNAKPDIPSITVEGSTDFCKGDSVILSVSLQEGYSYNWMKDGMESEITGAEFVIYEAGAYNLKLSNVYGCYVETPITQYGILDAPEQPEIEYETSLEFCEGDSVTLHFDEIAGCATQWILDGVEQDESGFSFAAKETGIYHVVATGTNGCKSNAIENIEVKVNPTPNAADISLNGSPNFCEGGDVELSVPNQTANKYQWFNQFGNITEATSNSYIASESGQYNVMIYNQWDCSFFPPDTIEVIAAETPPTQNVEANGATHICQGEEVQLGVNQNSAYGYQWELDGIFIDNQQNYNILATDEGVYTVEISNYDCSITTDPIEITYKPALDKPQLMAEGPNVWILACDNTTAELYRWFYKGEIIPEANEYIYVANQDLGEYYVSVNDGGECHVPSDIITIPLNSTGVTEQATLFGNIKIYPNPTPGMFTIEMDNQIIGTLYIRIVNELGKELFNIKHNKTTSHLQTEMDLSGQGDGVYFIEFRFEGDRVVRKLVVE